MLSNRFKRFQSMVLAATAVTAVAGCASGPANPAGGNGDAPLADSEAAFGYEQTDWGKPFWDKWLDSAREEGRAEAVRSGQAPATAVATTSAATSVDSTGLKPKLGLYIAKDARESMTSYRLISALERNAARHGLTLIKPNELDEAVGGSDACGSESPLDCPRLLAIFPGIRGLLVVDQRGSGDTVTLESRMMDPDFDIRYEPLSTRVQVSDGTNSDVDIWSDRILDTAADRIGVAPWFTHTFALKGEDMYINAGSAAGLKIGDELAIHSEGSLVRSPSGQVIAWEPGPEVGRVRVKEFVGENIALAEQVSGEMPKPKDRLTYVD
ncbi:hypothetical protein [uncultured Salinisphaera sp.]|uniref:hypothetical protein n=1 Tax=Salinisphaera sp. C84B14 TaxID=1304155 RepID=UPI0032B2EFBB